MELTRCNGWIDCEWKHAAKRALIRPVGHLLSILTLSIRYLVAIAVDNRRIHCFSDHPEKIGPRLSAFARPKPVRVREKTIISKGFRMPFARARCLGVTRVVKDVKVPSNG